MREVSRGTEGVALGLDLQKNLEEGRLAAAGSVAGVAVKPLLEVAHAGSVEDEQGRALGRPGFDAGQIEDAAVGAVGNV